MGWISRSLGPLASMFITRRKGADGHRRQHACTALLIFGSSKAPWPWPWPWIGSSHISMHSTCSTTSAVNHLTVASRTTEIWPFECREISTFREVWTVVIAFLEGNSKIGPQIGCIPCPILLPPTISFELHTKTAEEKDIEKCNFRNFGSFVTLTLDRVEVTLVCICGRGIPKPN